MIPRLLRDTPASFDVNGYGALTGTVSAIVTEELNGEYSLAMELSVTDPLFEFVHIGSVIAVTPNKTDARQGFVVEHISKPIDGICEIYAPHICQFRGKLIPVSPFSVESLANALTTIKNNSLEANPFTITTDKISVVSMRQTLPHSFRELLGGVEGSLIDTYGGELKYDNYSIELLSRRGRSETSIKVLYGTNMTDYTQDEDFSWSESITGILPFWAGDDVTVVVGSIQYSEKSDDFPYARTVALDCTDAFEEPPTAAELNAYALTYITDKGEPAISMEVTFDHLQSADKNIQIGDTVTVINAMYGTTYSRRIVATEYNVLADEYETVTIGELRTSLGDTINDMIDSSSAKPLYMYKAVTGQYTVAANNSATGTIDPAADGWMPIAIAGFSTGNNDVVAVRCDLWASDGLVHYVVRNLSSSSVSSTMTVKVSYTRLKRGGSE